MASDAAKLLGQLEDMLVAASDLKAGKDGANAIIVAWLRDNLPALRTAAAVEAAATTAAGAAARSAAGRGWHRESG